MRPNTYDPQAARIRLMLAVVGGILLVISAGSGGRFGNSGSTRQVGSDTNQQAEG